MTDEITSNIQTPQAEAPTEPISEPVEVITPSEHEKY